MSANARTVLAAALLALSVPSLAAPAGQRVELFEKRLIFVLPTGFTQLSKSEHDLKYSRLAANKPLVSYGNAKRSVSIAVTRPAARLEPAQLQEFLEAMASFLERSVPGLRWIRKEIVTVNGARWARMEFTAPALDTEIYNDMYLTSLGGQPVGVNLNSVVRLKASAVKLFEGVRRSLKVRNDP